MDRIQVNFWGFVVKAEGFRAVLVAAVLVVLLVVIILLIRTWVF